MGGFCFRVSLNDHRVEFVFWILILYIAHDFFLPQPPLPHPRAHPYSNALTIYLLRVVLHDWSDPYARKILQRLREGAGEETRLIIADHVLPLACEGDGDGALLKNMGKASANAYWMDMTVSSPPLSDIADLSS